MASLILINDTKAQSPQGGPQMFRAGSTIADAATQAAIAQEGGLLWPATDPVVLAQSVLVQKLRSQGMDEGFCSRAMLAGAVSSLNQGAEGASQVGVTRTVRLATTAALATGTFTAGTGGAPDTFAITATGTLTVDGAVTALNDRVLVKNQVTGSQNGIYYVSTAGAVGVAAVLTRAPDAAASADFVSGMNVMTSPDGTTNPTATSMLTTAAPLTLNTTSLTFSKIESLQEFTNGQILQSPQAVSTISLVEIAIGGMIGSGTIIGVYYLPNATSTPAAGSNSQAIVINIYNASGVLVGQLAAASIANATAMTKWVRFNLGTITNGVYADGYTLTASSTLTGTATLPAGTWIIVSTPN
jgi:hypothetical protein